MAYLLDEIKLRRSIRKFLDTPVSQDLIKDVLLAAGWAPSAHNAQPWRFIVLEDISVKQELADSMAESWTADMAKDGLKIEEEIRKKRIDRFATAPVLILACFTMNEMKKFPDKKLRDCERDLAIQGLGAAIQNMLLTAHAKGLGACWFCAPGFCKGTVRKVLKIPSDVEPQALILMGYPAEQPTTPPRKKLKNYAFKNYWGKEFT